MEQLGVADIVELTDSPFDPLAVRRSSLDWGTSSSPFLEKNLSLIAVIKLSVPRIEGHFFPS
jgi:hypothetical protein